MDNTTETKSTELFNRDQVLSQVDDLLKITDTTTRTTQTAEFIHDRLQLLTDSAVPKEFFIMSQPRKGFLHPDSGIRRNLLVDPFHIDDPEIYRDLLETFAEFKAIPAWQDKTLREIAPYAILRTIGNYFGNHWGTANTENNNRAFYMDHSGNDSADFHLNEFKGQGFAVCAEKAAVAQNLLSFLGYESELVASTKCRLESPDKDDAGGHMYNVIASGEKHFIFDPTNPILVKKDDDSIYTVAPAFYPINQAEYHKLMSGGQVEITHNDGIWDGQQSHKGEDQTRIYGGPGQTINSTSSK